MSRARIGAVVRKELTEFRRSRFIVSTMGVVPVIFLVGPTVTILTQNPSAPVPGLDKAAGFLLLPLLLIPVILPSTIAAYSVVGEREQETLEPVLTTPVLREEFLIGKAAAIFLPAVGVAYLVLGIFLAVVRAGANPLIAAAIWHSPELLATAAFIPLLAGWAIWVCLAISARANDVRVAQQLGVLASLPPVALSVLMSLQVVSSTLVLGASLAGALLVIDCGAYLVVSRLFDRERLVIGAQSGSGKPASTPAPAR